ncbi:MAG TPA: bifunctional diguanylate cyclase/phosphodiesterase [Egicoccus sp.]|nr:bifunctional diguanylate cyclase/phosphodiesterase [Egicoccus sp.]HSK24806.1 bifunctional diguanylate cyclase/phosphodiesterase [Egicoccus sp.]
MLVFGGVLGLVAQPAGVGRGLPTAPLSVISALAVLIGVVLARNWDRLPAWTHHPAVALASASICLSAWLAGPGSAGLAVATPLFVAALYAGFFFSLAAAAVHGTFAMFALSLAFAQHGQPFLFEVTLLAGVSGAIAVFSHGLAHGRARTEIDPLTGAYNRRGLERALDEAAAHADASATPLAVALLDLDDFKRHNDLHGHEEGDAVLVTSVSAWQELLPPGAALARLGGDEFVVVMPGLGLSAARRLLDALRRAVPPPVRCSAGVAAWRPGDTQSLVLGRADTALYAAKESGRDRTSVVGDESARAAEVWRAIEGGEFTLHYQPVTLLGTGQIAGVEALVRWQHPVEGLLGPGEFLPVAERCGAIHALGRWVLDETCRQVAVWRETLPAAAHLAAGVNVSTTQLHRAEFVDDVAAALRRHHLAPRVLTLEITEEAFEGAPEHLAALAWRLRDLGVYLAMDDFGTGHSSLARLQDLPFNVLKIDRSFVGALQPGQQSENVFDAIVALAESLGMRTVAEGIETAAQLDVVTRSRCTWAQGFALGRPMPAERLAQVLAGADDRSTERVG